MRKSSLRDKHHQRLSSALALQFLVMLLMILRSEAQESAHLIITEFVASNQSGLRDEDEDTSDWIELWNPSDQALSSRNLFLTDNPEDPTKWPLPLFTLAPKAFQIIFASGKNRSNAPDSIHSNFRLNRDSNGFLALVRQEILGTSVCTEFAAYPKQVTDVSYGFTNGDPARLAFFQKPTPGEQNDESSLIGYVADTQFSLKRGFYNDAIEVEFSTRTPGATLIHTVDGSFPSLRNGTRTQSPNNQTPPSKTISIAATTTLRVMAVRDGFESTNVDTQTYIFPSKVLQQDDTFHAIGETNSWGHAGPDWEMDPEIVQHSNTEVRPQPSDLLQIATVSLAFDFDEFFGRNGIYIAGQSVEKPSSIEFLAPDPGASEDLVTSETFQTEGTVQIVGGSSPNRWKSDKLSLRLKFEEDLEFPLFGRHAINRFDTLVLDARLNNVWHYGGGVEPVGQRNRAQYVRDQFTANLHSQLGGLSPHGRHVHLYLNGIYWGIHTLHERPDDNFAASYLGGDNEDYDSIKHRPNDVLQGDSTNYNRLHALADQLPSAPSSYDELKTLLDIPNFTDYMLVNYYVGNTDWAHHNWYASFNRNSAEGRWRFHSWDAEKGLHRVSDDLTGRNDPGGPTNLHRDLIRNPEYRLQFADRAFEALQFGELSPDRTRQTYLKISEPISLPLRIESARWGDNQRSVPYDRLDWLETRNQLLGESRQTTSPLFDYFSRRSEIVLDQFRRRGWLPSLLPPQFNQQGGFIDDRFMLSIQNVATGNTYLTTDGSDPRVPGTTGDQIITILIAEGARKRAIIPTSSAIEKTWFLSHFDDSEWPEGRRGAGYENGNGYQSLIDLNLDFKSQVTSNQNESIYLRTSFRTSDVSAFDQLTLKVRYDDGFIAYLNGVEVARVNSPGTPGTPQRWNIGASATHSDAEAVEFIPFDISSHISLLQQGDNVLALHGLNSGQSSSDFILWPTLEASKSLGGVPSGINPSAKLYSGALAIDEPTLIKARTLRGTEWSPLQQAAFLPNTVLPKASNLVISRIHYHPASPSNAEIAAGFTRRSQFEFVELTNLSTSHLFLSGSHFSQGVRFEFNGSLPQIPPNGSLIIAANPEAHKFRTQTDQLVVGPFAWESGLSNKGERISLEDPDGSLVFSVAYADSSPWPALADGAGFSLALTTLEAGQNLDLAEAWKALPQAGEQAFPMTDNSFILWQANQFGVNELLNENISGVHADPDGDGFNNLQEFFYATNPLTADHPSGQLRIIAEKEGQETFSSLEFTHALAIPKGLWTLETTDNLIDWTPINPVATEDAFQVTDNANQTRTIRRPIKSKESQRFYRLSLALP